jgi:hypothetical protein
MLMLYDDEIAVRPDALYIQRKNTLCGQNVEFFVVKPAGTENNHWASKGSEALDVWVSLINGIELSRLRFYILILGFVL